MKAVLPYQPGGPSALEYVEVPTPVPGGGEVLVKADTIGVSLTEALVRRGGYNWMPPLSAILGTAGPRPAAARRGCPRAPTARVGSVMAKLLLKP
jgi:NADPH:quinone reductase